MCCGILLSLWLCNEEVLGCGHGKEQHVGRCQGVCVVPQLFQSDSLLWSRVFFASALHL